MGVLFNYVLYLEELCTVEVFKLICGSDPVFTKVETAVATLRARTNTKRVRQEDSMPSPSDYAKKPGRSWILDHRGVFWFSFWVTCEPSGGSFWPFH